MSKYAVALHGDSMDVEVILVMADNETEMEALAIDLYRQDNDIEGDVYIDNFVVMTSDQGFVVSGHVEGGDEELMLVDAGSAEKAATSFKKIIRDAIKGNYENRVPPIYVDEIASNGVTARSSDDLESSSSPTN